MDRGLNTEKQTWVWKAIGIAFGGIMLAVLVSVIFLAPKLTPLEWKGWSVGCLAWPLAAVLLITLQCAAERAPAYRHSPYRILLPLSLVLLVLQILVVSEYWAYPNSDVRAVTMEAFSIARYGRIISENLVRGGTAESIQYFSMYPNNHLITVFFAHVAKPFLETIG